MKTKTIRSDQIASADQMDLIVGRGIFFSRRAETSTPAGQRDRPSGFSAADAATAAIGNNRPLQLI